MCLGVKHTHAKKKKKTRNGPFKSSNGRCCFFLFTVLATVRLGFSRPAQGQAALLNTNVSVSSYFSGWSESAGELKRQSLTLGLELTASKSLKRSDIFYG